MQDAKIESRQPVQPSQFAVMYAKHLPTILAYLRRRLGDEEAEDAAADVFTRALGAAAPPTDDPDIALPWLYGIAANVISERRRAERRRLRAIQRLAAQARASSDAQDEHCSLDPRLIRELRALSSDDRESILLIAWGELTYEQVAGAMQVPVGTVRSRVARARRQLRPRVTSHLRDAYSSLRQERPK